MARLKGKYREEVIPRLMELGGYKNIMQVPRLEKIVINIGMGCFLFGTRKLNLYRCRDRCRCRSRNDWISRSITEGELNSSRKKLKDDYDNRFADNDNDKNLP